MRAGHVALQELVRPLAVLPQHRETGARGVSFQLPDQHLIYAYQEGIKTGFHLIVSVNVDSKLL